ncbi:Zn(II)2Cys6 transcription factor [Penicillium odoratum]|uniref:Zn(II)2Cys6 transcription factor n=1 Tax=Penicillium odoratum TaxID=1167516 RepID=UPI002549A457|nr:Zn(II)2Cys6 transcription factor [Penicillium odoratum]KAJ5777376.1 Zn(II)2Cys6 transcription factor [Penicillium odoratum]
MDSSNSNSYPYDTARVSEILKRKRRVRGIKSCFPCRHRKVKCSGDLPCESCVSRGHPELCCVPSSESAENSRAAPIPSGNTGSRDSRSLAESPDGEADGDRLQREHSRNTIPGFDHSENDKEPSPDHTAGIDLMIKRLENIEEQISSLKADLKKSRANSSTGTNFNCHDSQSSNLQLNPHLATHFIPRSPGKNFVEDATGATIFLGGHSDPPAALGCRSAPGDGIPSDDLFLDQIAPRTYPFTSMWGPDAGAADVCWTLPEDSDIVRYCQIYQTIVYPYYPALVTLEQFNSSLWKFLDYRADLQQSNELSKLDNMDTSWLALLFAVLACGVQFSNDPIKKRDLQSKVFICSSFQCLRISNFFNNTNMDQIQAMALIGHCIRNNLDTNSAWILLGATMRLAQSIGLHEETISTNSSNATQQFQRKRLWWVLLWQDTFLSFTYDRPPSTIKSSGRIPYDPSTNEPGNHSLADCIMAYCQIILERSRKDEDIESVTAIMDYKQRIARILDDDFAAPFLRNKARCRTPQQHLQRLAFRIHYSYVLMRLLRLALKTPSPDPNIDTEAIKMECAERASDAVRAFLELHQLSSTVCRSWAFVHNAVSCAFTLQSLGMFPVDSELLITELVVILESEESLSSWVDSDTNVRHYGPYSRALRALKEFVS